ncbi:MAG: hypothetical protein VR70_09615 [Rhodospirillaceae bacterium BRH_c57]|nr:MAG: hypothetical protein VR70_09615 [Rhodospirillaceae bacterium BRH_c57]
MGAVLLGRGAGGGNENAHHKAPVALREPLWPGTDLREGKSRAALGSHEGVWRLQLAPQAEDVGI